MIRLTVAILLFAAAGAMAQQVDSEMKTVIGPSNPDLHDGAQALLQGRVTDGIELTKRGLAKARGSRELQAAYSNLCAGYVMLGNYETALDYCDLAVEENEDNWRALGNRALAHTELGEYEDARADIDKAQSIAPKAKKLKLVRAWLLDQTEPVAPTVTIDDRRDAMQDDEDAPVEQHL